MSEKKVFSGDIVIGQSNNGRSCYAVVERAGDGFEEDSDSDNESLENGCVHVAWYPEGKCQSVKETKLQLVDRSNLPRDIVRSKSSRQLGTVIDVNVVCDVSIVGTDKTIDKVNSGNFHHIQHLMENEIVAYGPWLGRIESVSECLVIRFPNGARARMSVDSDECELLGDVFPHPSDEGSFCDEDFQYFPGQSLSGSAKAFRNVEWLDTGPRPKLRSKAKIKVLVEQVEVHSIEVLWTQRALSGPPASNCSSLSSNIVNDSNEDEGTTVQSNPETSEDFEMRPSKNPSEDILEDSRSDYERLLGLPKNPHDPPPKRLEGERLKYVTRMLHFWKAHIDLGSRFLYQLTEEDAKNLNNRSKPSRKTKRVKRISAAKQKQQRKSIRLGTADTSPVPGGTNKMMNTDFLDNEVVVQSNSSSCSSTDDENDDEPVDVTETDRNGGVNSNDVGDSDEDDNSVDGSEVNNKYSYETIMKSIPLLTYKVGAFQFKIKGSESGIQVLLQNPHCPPKVLRTIKKMLTHHLNKMLRKLLASSDQNLSTNNLLKELMTQSVDLSALGMTIDQQEDDQFVLTGSLRNPASSTSDNVDQTLCDASNGLDADKKSRCNELLNQIPYCCQSLPGYKHQAGKKVNYEAEQFVTVEVCCTHSMTHVEWQDGVTRWHPAMDLAPAHHVDDHDFCPGDFVIKDGEVRPGHYGLVLKANNENRMVTVQWFNYNANEEKVETLDVEELSEYDVMDHKDFNFRISDIILRLHVSGETNSSWGQVIGELLRVTTDGKLLVKWTDDSESTVYPQEVFLIDPDDGTSLLDSSCCEDSDEDGSGWETESDDAGGSSGSSNENFVLDLPREGTPDLGVPREQNEDPPTPNLDESIEAAPPSIRSQMIADATVNSVIDDALSVFSMEQSPDTNPPEVNEAVVIQSVSADENEDDLPYDPAICRQFFSEEKTPENHVYVSTEFMPKLMKTFIKALRRDLALLRSSLPNGIYVKTYEDRMDLLSVLVEGPPGTPYENGIFLFDVQLPGDYPDSPPRLHYISYSHRLNPNLYVDGTVCISLLGTWSGKGNETWTENSNLLQVLVSIQGLILNSEPYYNEAGYEGHRATAEGTENSRCYNEMVILRLVEHMTALIASPPAAFPVLARELFKAQVHKLITRVESILRKFGSDPSDDTIICSSAVSHSPRPASSDVAESSDYKTNIADDAVIPLSSKNELNEEKPETPNNEATTHSLGFPLRPLSKGVQLSLKGKLERLVRAVDSCKLLHK